jgi:phenylacetate-CoA ligase
MRGIRNYIRFLYRIRKMINLERRTPRELAQRQLMRFRNMVAHAQRHSAFYRRRLAGIRPRQCVPRDIPPLTKTEVMEHFEEIVTDPFIKKRELEQFLLNPANVGKLYLDRYVACHTSGSQGQPIFIVQPTDALEFTFAAQAARAHNQSRSFWSAVERLFCPSRWAVLLLRPGFFPSGAAFGYMPAAMRKLVKVLRLDLTDPLENIVEKLNAFQPQIVTAYAHVLEQLAQEEKAGRLRLRANGNLQMLASMSEPLYPESRRILGETFGVHIANHYAMGECMGLGIGCPRSTGAHLNVDLGLLEVADEAGNPVPDGQQGKRVYITNLVNTVQPFIRYEIDDILRISPDPCPCGSPLPLIDAIAGRNNDRIWIQSQEGLREIPSFIFVTALHEVTELAEYQLIQLEHNRFHLLAQPLQGSCLAPRDVLTILEKTLARENMSGLLHIDIQITPSIAPDPRSGKHRRFISKLPSPNGFPTAIYNGIRLSA